MEGRIDGEEVWVDVLTAQKVGAILEVHDGIDFLLSLQRLAQTDELRCCSHDSSYRCHNTVEGWLYGEVCAYSMWLGCACCATKLCQCWSGSAQAKNSEDPGHIWFRQG